MQVPFRSTTLAALPYNQFTFRDLELLGEGGFGEVFRSRIVTSAAPRKPVGSEWARKRLNSRWAANPTMQARLDREITTLSELTHPNIITLEGQNLPGGERFYMMPIFSRSVRRLIADGTWIGKWKEIAHCGAQLADALAHAHRRDVRHRDLKPENLLFKPGGPVVIADWGLGDFVHQHSKVLVQLTRGGMGTEYYCSLEQWASGRCDQRGDIYSLGMTLDEWATGSQRAIVVGDGIDSDSVPSTSLGARRFNALLLQMTKRLAEERPFSMDVVGSELRLALREG